MSSVDLYVGRAEDFEGDADLILSNIYGPLPSHLRNKPMLIANFVKRHALCEEWCGVKLNLVSLWEDGRCAVWAGNTKVKSVDLTSCRSEDIYFPLSLPLALLRKYGKKGMTVWDGFCGRGTVGKACQELGINFIGGDIDEQQIEISKKYLSL
jgi:hypothetical protein